MKVFVSYATQDTNQFRIREIVEYLEIQDNIEHVYFWERDCNAGIGFNDYMREQIKNSDVIMVFCSDNTQSSTPVILEMGIAMANIKRIIPIFTEISHIFEHLQGTRGIQYDSDLSELCELLYFEITGSKPDKDPLDKTFQHLEDIKSLSDLFFRHNATGVDLYHFKFENSKIDTDESLFSGFLTAVSSFAKELIGDQKSGVEEISIGEYILSEFSGKFSTMTIISKGDPSPYSKVKYHELLTKFEANYENQFTNWRGNLSIFEGTLKLVEDCFYPMAFNPHILSQEEPFTLSEAEQNVYNTAKSIAQNHKLGFFYIPDLIKSTVAQHHNKPEKVYAIIRNFINSNVLIAADEPQAGETLRKTAEGLFRNSSFNSAVPYFQRLYQIDSMTDNFVDLTGDLMKLGICEGKLKKYNNSFQNFSKALEIAHKNGFIEKEILILHEMGLIARNSGDLNGSIDYFNRSYNLIKTQNSLVENYSTVNELISTYNQAEEFQKSLEIVRELTSILQDEQDITQDLHIKSGTIFNGLKKYQESLNILDEIWPKIDKDNSARYSVLLLQIDNSRYLNNEQITEKYKKLALITAGEMDPKYYKSESYEKIDPDIKKLRSLFVDNINRLGLSAKNDELWLFMLSKFYDILPKLEKIPDEHGRFSLLFELQDSYIKNQLQSTDLL